MSPSQRAADRARFCTIGHSNRELDTFLQLLRDADIALVVDVRSYPRSRSNPQFNLENLTTSLREHRIEYRHVPDLGGRRKLQPDVPDQANALWKNRSFHNYADYALGSAFAVALRAVIEAGRERRLALMCSEAVWWRCHRRIITDHLIARGHEVEHVLSESRIERAALTPGAECRADGTVVYPAPAQGMLDV